MKQDWLQVTLKMTDDGDGEVCDSISFPPREIWEFSTTQCWKQAALLSRSLQSTGRWKKQQYKTHDITRPCRIKHEMISISKNCYKVKVKRILFMIGWSGDEARFRS